MIFKVIATGSKGNCYLLVDTKGKMVILDCGIPWKEVLKAVGHNIRNIECLCCTHSHSDHSRSLADARLYGIKTYTWEDDGMKQYGEYRIKAFDLEHDVPCKGFFIAHPEMGRFVYITDTAYCRYSFTKLNNVLIECNYEDIAEDRPNYEHVVGSHMSLETTKQFLSMNYTPMMQKAILCHTSSLNLDRQKALAEVKKVIGDAEVILAEPGKTTELSEYPF